MITASSDCSLIRIKTLGHGEPLTVTERPFKLARASAMNEGFPDFRDSPLVILHKEDGMADEEATGSVS